VVITRNSKRGRRKHILSPLLKTVGYEMKTGGMNCCWNSRRQAHEGITPRIIIIIIRRRS
jgi:hypothetical protein